MSGQAGNNGRPQEGKDGFVYVIHAVGTSRVKVGYSADPEKRLLELQTGSPFPLSLVGRREGDRSLERAVHDRLRDHLQIGEWFDIDPAQCWEIVCAEPIPRPYIPPTTSVCRGSFAPATRLDHVPVVFYEILHLATRGQSAEIVPLIKSVIEVTQRQADSLVNLPRVASGEVSE